MSGDDGRGRVAEDEHVDEPLPDPLRRSRASATLDRSTAGLADFAGRVAQRNHLHSMACELSDDNNG